MKYPFIYILIQIEIIVKQAPEITGKNSETFKTVSLGLKTLEFRVKYSYKVNLLKEQKT